MAGTPVSGADGRITVGGVNLDLEEWDVSEDIEITETTGFEDAGYQTNVGSVKRAEVNAKGYWDVANNPHSNPPNIKLGQVVAATLYTSRTNNKFYLFPSVGQPAGTGLRVASIKISNKVKGRVDYEFTAQSTGGYTTPDGAAG